MPFFGGGGESSGQDSKFKYSNISRSGTEGSQTSAGLERRPLRSTYRESRENSPRFRLIVVGSLNFESFESSIVLSPKKTIAADVACLLGGKNKSFVCPVAQVDRADDK